MGLPKMLAQLSIFPKNKITFISLFDQKHDEYCNTIMLQYSPDIKELELQVLLHGYKFLEKNSTYSVDNYLEIFDLEAI
jgi:hypothetical protein